MPTEGTHANSKLKIISAIYAIVSLAILGFALYVTIESFQVWTLSEPLNGGMVAAMKMWSLWNILLIGSFFAGLTACRCLFGCVTCIMFFASPTVFLGTAIWAQCEWSSLAPTIDGSFHNAALATLVLVWAQWAGMILMLVRCCYSCGSAIKHAAEGNTSYTNFTGVEGVTIN